MKKIKILILKVLRKIYLYLKPKQFTWNYINDPQIANNLIYDTLKTGAPCMIARFGSNELNAIVNYYGVKYTNHSSLDYIRDKSPLWWWNRKTMQLMQTCAGFFPITQSALSRFGELMLNDIKYLDILGSWRQEENYISEYFPLHMRKIRLLYLEPFFNKEPWTRILEGKRVLVIHPFVKQMEQIYKTKRHLIFNNESVLPEFNLLTIQAVQSLGGDCSGFDNWFEALEWMKSEMNKIEYDIALIGCGAYGFPLAAYAKRTGHQAVHLGGVLQLLFGIKGKRWEISNYGYGEWGKLNVYSEMFNEYWEYPEKIYTPQNINEIEGGCYWG